MSDLLIELFSEEIPARMQEGAEQTFARLLTDRLKANELTFAACETYSTPRRLTVHVTGLLAERPRRVEEIKGPKTDAPAQALEGFLKKNGIADVKECAVRELSGVPYYFYDRVHEGAKTADILGDLIADAITNMTWPKSMRWGNSTMRWARPLHSVLALLDGAVVKGSVTVGPDQTVTFGNLTRGHRFMSEGKDITVTSFEDYRAKLAAASVVLARVDRRKIIWEGVEKTARDAGLTAKPDEKLLDEVVGLVEYPIPFMGTFEEEFLDIPPEVITTSMRENQRYFSVLTEQGKLANRFICVANLKPTDDGKTIIYGNEKVLRARLSDARFFWDQDRKLRLDDYLPRLKDIRFHEKLGSVEQKVIRLEALARFIAGLIGADTEKAARAALLCKADLVTGMVREFPELQGIMGGYYARKSGEDEGVATAIAQHYTPAGPSDTWPTDKVAVAVALADKIDTLVGFFSIDERPTGSKDPFALRRAALGVIRTILENKVDVSLLMLLNKAAGFYNVPLPQGLVEFIQDRFKGALKDQGLPHNVIEAVLASVKFDQLTNIAAKVQQLADFVGTDGGQNLVAAMGRVLNILKSADPKDLEVPQIEEGKLLLLEEKELLKAFQGVGKDLPAHIQASRYGEAMACLASIRPQVDSFFDKVTVNDNDPVIRRNRLAILVKIRDSARQIADFSKL